MSLVFPKGPTRKQEQAARVRVAREAREACVRAVFQRDAARCVTCRARVKHATDPAATEFNVGHVHEIKSRALGGDPTDPANCRLLCLRCHGQAHRQKMGGSNALSR